MGEFKASNRSTAWILLGVLAIQAAWILAIPPFRGSDEFDHAFRAAGVADGQWRLTEPAESGRGLLVVVDKDLVAVASAQCAALFYTGRDNCFPVEESGQGKVVIATAASAYNPGYYAVIGWAGKVFEGTQSLYAMRIASAVLCAFGIALSWWALAVARAGRWARTGFIVGLTPVMLYSTALPAPNGLEMVAGLGLWSSLLAHLSRVELSVRTRSQVLVMVGGSAGLLAVLRTLGPVWILLIALSVVGVVGLRTSLSVVRRHSWASMGVAGFVSIALILGFVWNSSAGLLGQSSEVDGGADDARSHNWVARVIVWTVQIVGAFPLRDEPAPTGVYALYFCVVIPLCFVAITRSRGMRRFVVSAGCLTIIALPIAITLTTAQTQGVIWQGRYQMPFVAGLLMLVGWVVDQQEGKSTRINVLVLGTGMWVAAQAWSLGDVADRELSRSVSVGDPNWVTLPPVILFGIAAVGGGLMVVGVLSECRHSRLSKHESQPEVARSWRTR